MRMQATHNEIIRSSFEAEIRILRETEAPEDGIPEVVSLYLANLRLAREPF